ncbi:chromate resistance protein ChrB domain-containing protein [Hoeflea ulvae]|uniref:Chromate resistance protein n=1 Tax=Hoeflea ulvae TaxID=2983764 RepID=A0ABT3YJW1_9HYPH|nr:chromate resistance protein ChrB domain-containing protein [Hoeflea ulvae]MCY0096170.1 chromate resistance protein [Hoeflea ulvae]
MSKSISAHDLSNLSGTNNWPTVVAATRCFKFEEEARSIAGSVWRDHMQTEIWGPDLARLGRPIVVYCLHGHNVSQLAVARLRAQGFDARHLEGGIDAYEAAGGLVLKQRGPDVPLLLPQPTLWITSERPGGDGLGFAWLVRRFIDPLAQFHFVEAEWVVDIAEEMGAIPFAVEGARNFCQVGETCSADKLLDLFGIEDPALRHFARILRGASAGADEPQSAGLQAILRGLSSLQDDDLAQLENSMVIHDALFAWCRHATRETQIRTTGKAAA